MNFPTTPLPAHPRGIFCNRTLNLRAINAIGFDMDYTLIQYHSREWEERAYEHTRARFKELGWPVDHLAFDPDLVALGLIIDLELGNVVKADRFGYIKKAAHGTRMLPFDEQRKAYWGELVSLSNPRWVFLNTLFGLSEGCLYAQLVDVVDQGQAPKLPISYLDLYKLVRANIDEAHMEGALKNEIVSDPKRFVEDDPDIALTLLDLKAADKKLLLITNSGWTYTQKMMSYALDRHLPKGTTWRDLFELVIISARKPTFFMQDNPIFEVTDERGDGLLTPASLPLRSGGVYFGGHAALVEKHLGVPGENIFYIGDHIYADLNVSKNIQRWRTALVVRALEREVEAIDGFAPKQALLTNLMHRKMGLEHTHATLRLAVQRAQGDVAAFKEQITSIREALAALDSEISPLAKEYGELVSPRWGLLMRTGNDKSHLARQIERHADVYMSRVSNLLAFTPFAYLRTLGGSLPHDGEQ